MEKDRRATDRLAARLGALVLDARVGARLSKTELGRRTGISRQMVAVVETGSGNPSVEVIDRLLQGCMADLDWVVHKPVELITHRVRDGSHAATSACIQRRLERAGWLVAREVGFEDGRYRGWIDLLAYHPGTGTLLVIEVKTRLDDIGGLERSLDWYTRVASAAARRLGWRAQDHPRMGAGAGDRRGRPRDQGASDRPVVRPAGPGDSDARGRRRPGDAPHRSRSRPRRPAESPPGLAHPDSCRGTTLADAVPRVCRLCRAIHANHGGAITTSAS